MSETNEPKQLSIEQLMDKLSYCLESAKAENIRIPVVVEGELETAWILCQKLALRYEQNSSVYVESTHSSVNNLYGKNANFVIGKEYDAIFFHFDNSSDPNLFAALAGTVKGGGIFVILLNPGTEYKRQNNFYTRILSILKKSHCIFIKTHRESYSIIGSILQKKETQHRAINFTEQKQAIQQIISVATGRTHRPLVLSAQRGRGKSAALGIACTELLNKNNFKIIVTAPSFAAATVLYKHFNSELKNNEDCLQFVAPDDLIENLPEARLIIVDEAAAIPTPILKIILDNYSRIVFATTTHGYEGSGQSFTMRFRPYLQKKNPEYKLITLETPIRWHQNDPLEPLINQLFLLTTDTQTPQFQISNKSDFHFQKHTQNQLMEDESTLKKIFGLLQIAHYKTRPSDLKQLLDNEQYQIFSASYLNEILAIAIGINEGSLDPQLTSAIYQGKRRPSGELLPQTLIFHLQQVDALEKHYLRISRIAVHSNFQQQGIGTALLEFIEKQSSENYDYIGSSFGATPEILSFWLKQDYQLLRIGHFRKASSAMYPAFVIKPLQEINKSQIQLLHRKFLLDFNIHLTESLQNLESETVNTILQFGNNKDNTYPALEYWQTVYSYAFFDRSYEDCIYSLKICSLFALHNSKRSHIDYNLIIQKIIQNLKWDKICKNFNLTGKKFAEQKLKMNLALLIIEYAIPETKYELLKNKLNKI